MRHFTVCHISDLHVRTGKESSLAMLTEAIPAALTEAGRDNAPEPRILLVTGDLVDRPSGRALTASMGFLQRISSAFRCFYIIPGNHDVKRLIGNFWRTGAFAKMFEPKRSMLIRPVGLHILGIDSTAARFARGGITPAQHNLIAKEVYRLENHLPESERHGLLRIAALHHHPLPLAGGEGAGILGVLKDESFMYLRSPARVLQAFLSCGVSVVLHGHRHVPGLVRYSVQSGLETQDWSEDQWASLYVLSCPSTTGEGGQSGGFNVLSFKITANEAYLDVRRYQRQRNEGRFELLDANRPTGLIRLPLGRELRRDSTVDVKAGLAELPKDDAPEGDLYQMVRDLFCRRAFYIADGRNWGKLLYIYVRTRYLWNEEVLPRLRPVRRETGERVLAGLAELEGFVRGVLGCERQEQDRLAEKYLERESEFLRHLPMPCEVSSSDAVNRKNAHQQMLKKLAGTLLECRVAALNLGDRWNERWNEE